MLRSFKNDDRISKSQYFRLSNCLFMCARVSEWGNKCLGLCFFPLYPIFWHRIWMRAECWGSMALSFRWENDLMFFINCCRVTSRDDWSADRLKRRQQIAAFCGFSLAFLRPHKNFACGIYHTLLKCHIPSEICQVAGLHCCRRSHRHCCWKSSEHTECQTSKQPFFHSVSFERISHCATNALHSHNSVFKIHFSCIPAKFLITPFLLLKGIDIQAISCIAHSENSMCTR